MYTLAIALLFCGSPNIDYPIPSLTPMVIATDTTDRSVQRTAEDVARLPAPLRMNRKLNNGTDAPRSQRGMLLRGVFTRSRALTPRQYNPKLRAHRQRVHRLKQRRHRKHALRNYRVP